MELSVVVLYLAFLPALLTAQSEGDVRLVGAIPDKKGEGRLEIFWRGEWGTVCGTSANGANAACRQLGFNKAFIFPSYRQRGKYNINVTAADEKTPIALVISSACTDSYSNHVLRCGYNFPVPSSCSHDDDVLLKCFPTSLWQHPYQTQVRLASSSYPSSGVLEIYIDDQWGNVCGNESQFDKGAADSACRQMGYTGAQSFSTSSQASTPTTWLSNVKCGSNGHSCNCLNGCFGKAPSKPTSCPDGTHVNLTCTFNVTIVNSTEAGSYGDCSNYQGTCASGSYTAVVVAAAVVASLAVGVTISIVVAVLVVCFVVSSRKRGYYTINN